MYKLLKKDEKKNISCNRSKIKLTKFKTGEEKKEKKSIVMLELIVVYTIMLGRNNIVIALTSKDSFLKVMFQFFFVL
jgi:hypothetical protein